MENRGSLVVTMILSTRYRNLLKEQRRFFSFSKVVKSFSKCLGFVLITCCESEKEETGCFSSYSIDNNTYI